MSPIRADRNKQSKTSRQLFIATVFCLVIPDLFAQSGIKITTRYSGFNNNSPCFQASQDRLLQQGFAEDWHALETCENPRNLWWILALKPKVHGGKKTKKSAEHPEEIDVVFEFKSDFGTRLEHLITERYNGPPKWMPPHLAYWDPYIGDWRYRRTNLNDRVYEQSADSELVMFWVRYEHDEDGIILDTSFDFSRLLEVFDVSIFRVDGITSKILDFLKTGAN